MKRLTRIYIDGLKVHDREAMEVPQFLALSGPNGAGKSAVLEAIRLAVLGYEPSLGKTLKDTRKLLADGYSDMAITLGFSDGFEIDRRLGASTVTRVHPTRNERTEKELQSRIDRETGAFIPSFDLAAFLDLSAEKRREFLLRILPRSIANLDVAEWRRWLGYDGAESFIQSAITKLWDEHVEPSESILDGLATALQRTTEAFNAAEQARREQVAIAERADQDARTATESVDYDPDRLTALQADLQVATETNTRWQEAISRADRARTEQRHREHMREVLRCRLEEVNAALNRLQASAAPKNPTHEEFGNATLHLHACQLEEGKKRDAFGQLAELMGSKTTEMVEVQKRLTAIANHNTCPTCEADTGHLDTVRAKLREQIEYKSQLALAMRADHDQLKREVEAAAQEVQEANTVLSLLHRRRADAEDYARREDLLQVRAEEVISEKQAFDALPALEIQELQDEAAPTARITTIQNAIRAEQELAQRAGRAEADRARADRERHELAKRTAKSEALGTLKQNQQKLRAHVIEQLVGPVESRANELLYAIDPAKTFRFIFEREGRDTFDFGFEEDGVFRSYDAASTGEDAFLAVVLVAALVATVQPAWPVLLLDNAEAIDTTRRRWLLDGLRKMSDVLGNVIIAGCCTFPDVEGWTIHQLGSECVEMEAVA